MGDCEDLVHNRTYEGMVNYVCNYSMLWLVIGIQCLVSLAYGIIKRVEGQLEVQWILQRGSPLSVG